MKKYSYRPYGINIKYEYKTYKNVGIDYGNRKDADLGWFDNFRRFLRKQINQKKNLYAFCNTYSEWETHVKEVVNKNILNSNDLIHWLYGRKHFEEIFLAGIKTILIPIYITLFSLSDVFGVRNGEEFKLISLILVLIMIVFFSLNLLYNAMNRVNFFNDFILIAEKELDLKGY